MTFSINKTKLHISILLILFFSIIPSKAFGVDFGFYAANDILYYDPSCVASGGSSGTLLGNDNTEKAIRFFVGKGLTLIQAVGIVGNFEQESPGINPSLIQGGDLGDENYNPINGVDGFGIAQWTSIGRQENLVNFAKNSNRKINDLSMQLDFAWGEMEGLSNAEGDLAGFKGVNTNPVDTAVYFHDWFERSADSDSFVITVRGGNATKFYDQYKSIIADGSGSSGGGSSTTSGSSGACGSSENKSTNGAFIFYNQNDPAWKDIPLGNASLTIGSGGCGPTSMAMIITALTGKKVDPVEAGKFATDNGLIDGNNGSFFVITQTMAEAYGLKASKLPHDVIAVSEALKRGSMIHMSGAGPNPFTEGGHFIAIRGITDSGKWLLADPYNPDNNTIEWEPGDVLNDSVGGNIWEVSK